MSLRSVGNVQFFHLKSVTFKFLLFSGSTRLSCMWHLLMKLKTRFQKKLCVRQDYEFTQCAKSEFVHRKSVKCEFLLFSGLQTTGFFVKKESYHNSLIYISWSIWCNSFNFSLFSALKANFWIWHQCFRFKIQWEPIPK